VRYDPVFLIALFAILMFVPTVPAADDAVLSELLSKHYRLEKPGGEGPFPAVMMVPGCSGFDADIQKESYNVVQSQLVELGFATLRVNSLAARNAASCSGAGIYPADGANDIYIAAEYLLQQPFVKKGAINIIGWSWGGAAALLALRPAESQEPLAVDAVVAYYPACNWVQTWDSEIPVLVLAGSLDNVARYSTCEKLFNSVPQPDKITVRIYDGAHHGFDNFQLPAEKQYMFGTLGYNEAAAKSAWKEVTNFLRK
jgi:dienelactone hydrolase